jgi:CCR4-NOT complex subunit CAF16
MHQISDGERRRVQIVQGLMAPWDILLLDEVGPHSLSISEVCSMTERIFPYLQVTVDLDVLVRQNLLEFLKAECAERNATVLYATHIFDGLDGFPTHVAHIQLGTTTQPEPIPWPITSEDVPGVPKGVLQDMENTNRAGSRMLALALRWLKEDKQVRHEFEERGDLRARGRKKNAPETTDSETFYRKYDYW